MCFPEQEGQVLGRPPVNTFLTYLSIFRVSSVLPKEKLKVFPLNKFRQS